MHAYEKGRYGDEHNLLVMFEIGNIGKFEKSFLFKYRVCRSLSHLPKFFDSEKMFI